MPAKPPDLAHRLSVETLQAKVAREPDNPFLLNELGNQLAGRGRLEEAADRYHDALTLDPHFAIAWNNLGVTLLALGRFTRAKWAFGHAIDDAPTYAMAYYNLGAAYDSVDDFDGAVTAYEKALTLDPTLLDVKKNPQIVSNRHVAEVLVKTYIDRGGTALLPLQSAYPAPDEEPSAGTPPARRRRP